MRYNKQALEREIAFKKKRELRNKMKSLIRLEYSESSLKSLELKVDFLLTSNANIVINGMNTTQIIECYREVIQEVKDNMLQSQNNKPTLFK